jgi:hemerythrin superfamily protein
MSRSLAQQTVTDLGGPGSVLARQRRDHVELDHLLRRLQTTAGAEQDEVLTEVCRLVFSHAFAEEAVLWPAVRAVLPDGEQLTLRVEQEHQEINELVRRLEGSRHTDPGRGELLDRVVRLLDEDVRDEEDVVLPRLQAVLDPQELNRLGRSWEALRRTAPTRAHPGVSRRPPGNVLAALPLTLLDRSRDVLDRLARRAPSPVAPVAVGASAGLRVVADAVERLAPLRHGEHDSTREGRTA